MATDTKGNTLGAGAREVGDLCLHEDGTNRSGTLSSDVIASETASEGWSGEAMRKQVCQRALTGKQTLVGGGGALERGHSAPLEPLEQLGDALGGIGALVVITEATELVASQPAGQGGCVNGWPHHRANRMGWWRTRATSRRFP